MQTEQVNWNDKSGWVPEPPGKLAKKAQLVLVFGGPKVLLSTPCIEHLREVFPHADVVGCSTAGEIGGSRVYDDSLVATAVYFENTQIKSAKKNIADASESYQTGCDLAQALDQDDLVHLFVISDGLHVNGSELVRGIVDTLPGNIPLTGGLSGDGDRFKETFVVWNGPPESKTVGIIGFYGNRLRVGYGSRGGWSAFGQERLITRSENNILYELDGKPALDLYKKYLGEDQSRGLPATGLLFPLSIRGKDNTEPLVRTILSVNEEAQSMTFAGDIPEGNYARLMKSNFDRLLDGASQAAETALQPLSQPADLAILVSCVGRKLVLKQIVDEEVEAVQEILGPSTLLTGFYSYGEIAPFNANARCELHNQTMTITTFSEI